MALADLTPQQRAKLKRIMLAVAAEQSSSPERLLFNQLFDALFDTPAQRATRVDNVLTMYRDAQQAALNVADANNTAAKAALSAEIDDANTIMGIT